VDGLVRALEAEPGVGLATPKVLLRSDPALVNACGNEMHYTGFTTCRGYRRESAAYTGTHAVTLVSGAVFAVRSELLRRLGGMDPLFYMYLEDADLSVRAALAGFRSICVPSVTAIHDWEPRFSAAKIHWLERNRVLLVLRIYRARTLLLMAPALFLAEILALGYAALHGPNVVAAKLRAWVWVVRSSPGIARSRRRIQRARTIPDRILLDSLAGGLNIDELPGRLPGVAAAAMNPLFRLWLGFLRRAVTW
jgi:GT2 family glycosyltransferase